MDSQENYLQLAKEKINPNRPSVYRRKDGKIGFRPSEIGKCIRGHIAAFNGHEPEPFSEKTKRIMSQGEIHEKHIAYDTEKYYQTGVILRQVRLEMPIEDWGIIEGTCDGVYFWIPEQLDLSRFLKTNEGPWHDPETYHLIRPWLDDEEKPIIAGFEAKASAPSMFEKMAANGPTENYKYQYSTYWAMIEHHFNVDLNGYIFAIGNRLDGDRAFHMLESPAYTKEQIINRCREIYNSLNHDLFDISNPIYCDETEYTYNCKWWRVCRHLDKEENREEEKNKKIKEYDPSFEQLIISDIKVSKQIEALESNKKELRQRIEESLRNRKKVSCKYGSVSVVEGRTSIDEDALKQSDPELYNKYLSKFDTDAAVKENPEIKKLYSKKTGKDYIVIRPNEKEIEKLKLEARKEESGIDEKISSRSSYQDALASRVESEAFLNELLDIKSDPGFH